MASGDGLIVRVRPLLARLTAAQVLGLCAAALAHGSGIVELTSRANVQLRGVRAEAHEALLEAICGRWGCWMRTRRWRGGGTYWWHRSGRPGTTRRRMCARSLIARLGELPDLPAKFGFAVDCGRARRCWARASADIRVERGVSGGLILRADGCGHGACR